MNIPGRSVPVLKTTRTRFKTRNLNGNCPQGTRSCQASLRIVTVELLETVEHHRVRLFPDQEMSSYQRCNSDSNYARRDLEMLWPVFSER